MIQFSRESALISLNISTSKSGLSQQKTQVNSINQSCNQFDVKALNRPANHRMVETIQADKKFSSFWLLKYSNNVYNTWRGTFQQAYGKLVCFVGKGDFLLTSTVDKFPPIISASSIGKNEDIPSGETSVDQRDIIVFVIRSYWSRNTFNQIMSVAHDRLLNTQARFRESDQFHTPFVIGTVYEFLIRKKNGLNHLFREQITGTMPIRRDGFLRLC